MSQQHLLLDFCPQPLQNRAMGRPIIQVESHNMRTDRIKCLHPHKTRGVGGLAYEYAINQGVLKMHA